MANEIIVLERNGQQQQFAFYYPIPAENRIEIGGESTTGQYPVLSPTSGMSATLLLVLTQPEKDALDAGEAAVVLRSYDIAVGTPPAQVLTYARQMYLAEAPALLAEYLRKFEFVGLRYDKE